MSLAEGTELRVFGSDILDVETYAELCARKPAFNKIYDSQEAFKKDAYLWAQIAEYGFDTYMMIQQRQGKL